MFKNSRPTTRADVSMINNKLVLSKYWGVSFGEGNRNSMAV